MQLALTLLNPNFWQEQFRLDQSCGSDPSLRCLSPRLCSECVRASILMAMVFVTVVVGNVSIRHSSSRKKPQQTVYSCHGPL